MRKLGSVVRLHNLRHSLGKAVQKDRLRQYGRSRYLFADARDCVAVRVSGNENYRRLAYLSKPPSNLDAFAASFEIDVHQDDIGLIDRCAGRPELTGLP